MPVAGILALAVSGCGGGGEAGRARAQIRTSVGRYVTALARHDAAAACNVITPAYWSATATELVAQLHSPAFANLPRESCRQGLARVFSGAASAGSVAKFTVSNLHVSGRSATAHLTLGASTSGGAEANSRFVRTSSGVWEIDCCTGSQLAGPSTVTVRIPSGAMVPTLRVGQTVTVDTVALRSRPPRLGDIVVFHPPAAADSAYPRCGDPREGPGHRALCGTSTDAESAQTFIRRVVGLPGDHIAMRNGHVIRNGLAQDDSTVFPCPASQAPYCTFTTPIVVPAGEYFLLGDNRPDSEDSRVWGPVKRSWIIGLAK